MVKGPDKAAAWGDLLGCRPASRVGPSPEPTGACCCREPFSILPLEAICETALANVRELQATNSGGSGASGGRPRRLSANELVTAAEAAGLAAAGDAAAGNSTDGLALAPPHQLVQ